VRGLIVPTFANSPLETALLIFEWIETLDNLFSKELKICSAVNSACGQGNSKLGLPLRFFCYIIACFLK
jgi:hypothetical protein